MVAQEQPAYGVKTPKSMSEADDTVVTQPNSQTYLFGCTLLEKRPLRTLRAPGGYECADVEALCGSVCCSSSAELETRT